MKLIKTLIFLSIPLISIKAQIKESFSFTADTYEHNSSNYASKHPPIELIVFSNQDILSIDQNNNFIKLNKEGEVIWKKKFDETFISFKKIILDNNEDILISFNNEIKKFNSDGDIIWKLDLNQIFDQERLMINSIAVNEENEVFLTGQISYTEYLFLIKIDSESKIVWSAMHKQKNCFNEITFIPKESIIFKNDLFLVNNCYEGSIIYRISKHGQILNSKLYDFGIINIKPFNNRILALVTDSGYGKYKILQLNENLETEKSSSFTLANNAKYKRQFYVTDSITKNTEIKTVEVDIADYGISDFKIDNQKNIIVIGNSAKKLWIMKLNIDGEKIWDWIKEQTSFYTYNNPETTYHRQSLLSFYVNDDNIITSGISLESDDFEKMFTYKINLFIKKLQIDD